MGIVCAVIYISSDNDYEINNNVNVDPQLIQLLLGLKQNWIVCMYMNCAIVCVDEQHEYNI